MIIKVEMGEGVVAAAPHIIVSVGIGSCVVVALYDATRKAGGLAHVMLPEKMKKNPEFRIQNSEERHSGSWILNSEFLLLYCQSADTSIPALLEELRKLGCQRQNLVARIAGGAKMFPSYAIAEAGIGEQNIRSVRRLLELEGIPLKGWDTGGCHGRNLEFHLDAGRVVVKTFGRQDREI